MYALLGESRVIPDMFYKPFLACQLAFLYHKALEAPTGINLPYLYLPQRVGVRT
jgi:hypothetical protein